MPSVWYQLSFRCMAAAQLVTIRVTAVQQQTAQLLCAELQREASRVPSNFLFPRTGWSDHVDAAKRLLQSWAASSSTAVNRLRLLIILDHVLLDCTLCGAQSQAGEQSSVPGAVAQ